ncbi:MAG: hypothetical protein IKL16_01940 [Clostridia bacterium]|nr:hypothetical protein [Clostridia bacterium]
MKKTMRKSALLSSVAMLIVSAIVLTSATYAWFSSAKQVTVAELSAEVKVSTGLLININHGAKDKWGTKVDFEDADAVKATWGAGLPTVFDPVSTSDGNDWMAAVYEEGKDGAVGALVETQTAPVPGVGGKFIAVPLWVTGPAGAKVEANITFGGDDQAKKCAKFALVEAETSEGSAVKGDKVKTGAYTEAVAAVANPIPEGQTKSTFVGVSSAGTSTETAGAYVTNGGTTITEVSAEGGITFDIPAADAEGNPTCTVDNPMMFIAFVWLEGNDVDCDMLKFENVEDIDFSMTLDIVD